MINTKNHSHCWAEIDLSAIKHNVKQIKDFVGENVRVMPIIKAEAYGHGMVKTAKALQEVGIDAFGVATVEEGVRLREAGIQGLILVLYDTSSSKFIEAIINNLSLSLFKEELIVELNNEAKKLNMAAKVHLAVDTGMSWFGIAADDTLAFAKKVRCFSHIEIEGIFSHCSQADSSDKTYTKNQISKFNSVLNSLENENIYPKLKHIANSAATLSLPDSHFDMVRPGLAIYGIYPDGISKSKFDLKPAFSFKTKVIQVRNIPANTPIGYGGTFVSPEDITIAVLPIGYSDGVSRKLSNKGKVIINGHKLSIVGNVCMNITMVNVTSCDVKTDDIATIIGRQGSENISADDIANTRETISYEVLTNLGINNERAYK